MKNSVMAQGLRNSKGLGLWEKKSSEEETHVVIREILITEILLFKKKKKKNFLGTLVPSLNFQPSDCINLTIL